MKVNFQSVALIPDNELAAHGEYLADLKYMYGLAPHVDTSRAPPMGYQDYVCVDVLGSEFVWMNEHFSREKFTWYLWYQSVFLVPPEMVTFLELKWS